MDSARRSLTRVMVESFDAETQVRIDRWLERGKRIWPIDTRHSLGKKRAYLVAGRPHPVPWDVLTNIKPKKSDHEYLRLVCRADGRYELQLVQPAGDVPVYTKLLEVFDP